MGVTSKMTRMVLLYTLILSMVSLPTNNYKLRDWAPCTQYPGDPCGPLDYSESKGPKKNFKKELMKITDDMKRQGKDYGGFTDFLKEAVEVVGPALQKGMNAVMENLNKGSEKSGKTEKDGQDYGGYPRPSTPFGKNHLLRPGR